MGLLVGLWLRYVRDVSLIYVPSSYQLSGPFEQYPTLENIKIKHMICQLPMHILGVFWYVYGLRIIHWYCYNVLMKCVMLPFHVHYTVTNVLLLPLMSENAPYTGLYIGPLLNVCPGGLWIDYIWIFDTLFRPHDAFCMSLYCQK